MDAALEIEQAFSFLEQDLAYRRGRSEYDRAHFGNALVEYQSPRLRIRVTKDRGQFFCAFAAPKEPVEWFDQEIILRDLGEGEAADDLIAQMMVIVGRCRYIRQTDHRTHLRAVWRGDLLRELRQVQRGSAPQGKETLRR